MGKSHFATGFLSYKKSIFSSIPGECCTSRNKNIDLLLYNMFQSFLVNKKCSKLNTS